MVRHHNYVMVHLKEHPTDEDEPRFVLSFAQDSVYASRDLTEDQLRSLRDDITTALDDATIDPRPVQWGDVYRGTTMIDPNDDDIPF